MYDFESSSSSHEEEKFGANVLDSLRSGEINDREAIKIGHIGQELHQKLDALSKDNIFSEADRKRWEQEIQKIKSQSPKDANALKNINQRIDQERNEIQKLTKNYVSRMEENSEAFTKDSKRGLDSIKEYLKEFQELDFKGKLDRFNNLQKDIDDRFATIEAILKVDPDMGPHLKTMRRSEREAKLKELEKSINKEFQPHEKLIQEFKELPSKFRDISSAEFRKLTLQAKNEKMKEMVKAMDKDYDRLTKKASVNQAKSEKDIQEARDYFFNKETPLVGKFGKIKAYEMFESQLEKDLILVRNFKEAIEEFPSKEDLKNEPDSQYKEMRKNLEEKFYKASYTEREKMINDLEGTMNEMNTSYNGKYLEELQGYQQKGVISMKTLREYSVWYMLQPLKDKSNYLYEELPKQMGERQNVLAQFQQALSLLPSDKATLYKGRFFNQELGGSARQKIFDDLLKELNIKKEDLHVLPVDAASLQDPSNISAPAEIEGSSPGKINLHGLSNADLQKLIDEALNEQSLREGRELLTSLDYMVEAASDDARRNGYQAQADKRTFGLTAEQRELQEEMNEQADNNDEVVLVKDKSSGAHIAQKVTKVDITTIHEKDRETIYGHEQRATRLQNTAKDDRADLGRSVQFVNEAGETISIEQSKQQLENEKAKMDSKAIKIVEQKRSAAGKPLSEQEKRQLRQGLSKKDKKVKLQADYSKV